MWLNWPHVSVFNLSSVWFSGVAIVQYSPIVTTDIQTSVVIIIILLLFFIPSVVIVINLIIVTIYYYYYYYYYFSFLLLLLLLLFSDLAKQGCEKIMKYRKSSASSTSNTKLSCNKTELNHNSKNRNSLKQGRSPPVIIRTAGNPPTKVKQKLHKSWG